MRIKSYLVVLIFLLIFPIISSATIQENTQFKPSDTNTTFIMGNNLSFDLVEIHSTYLKLDNNTIFANSSVGSVNITIFNFTDNYKKFNETKSDSGATISHIISNFTANTQILVKKDSVAWTGLTSNSSGYISFTYSSSYPITFEVEAGTMPITSTITTTTTSSGGGYPTYHPTQEQMQNEFSKNLGKNWKIKFNLQNETHELKINNIQNNSATITISSEPQTFNLSINETKKINLNDDGYYDLQVFLKNITGTKYYKRAEINIKLINETISVPTETNQTNENIPNENIPEEETSSTEIKKSKFNYLIIFGIILIVLIFFIIRKLIKKRTSLSLENY